MNLELITTPNSSTDEYTASAFKFTFANLRELSNNQCIKLNNVEYNENLCINDKVCILHLSVPIASISSINAPQRIGILCPFNNFIITFIKMQMQPRLIEITRMLIPKKLSIQMFSNAEDGDVHIKHGSIFISSKLEKLRVLSQGFKIFMSCVVPSCNQISFKIENNKLVTTNPHAVSTDTSNSSSVTLQDSTNPPTDTPQAVSTAIYFALQEIMNKGIVLYLVLTGIPAAETILNI